MLSAGMFEFFGELEANNNKAWFDAHRGAYRADILEPMQAFTESLGSHRQPFKFFRLNRDVRFSADKSPYKTMLGAVHHRPGGGLEYLHIDSKGLLAAAGWYVFERDQQAAYRAALLDEACAQRLDAVEKRLIDAGLEFDPGGAAPLEGAPKGIAKDHPRARRLGWKGLVILKRWTPGDAANDGVGDQVQAFWQQCDPLQTWLESAIRRI